MMFSWLKITCPYCAARISISDDRCPQCRSIIPHEAGDKVRGRFFLALSLGAALGLLLLLAAFAAIVMYIFS